MKRTKRLFTVAILNIVWGSCLAGFADAAPITTGTWTAMNPTAFWNNTSLDGPGLNVGQLITSWGWTVEYLNAGGAPVGFAFDQTESFYEIVSITSWMDGRGLWQMGNGSITYTSHGHTFNSLTNPQQFALFRWVGATDIVYFLGIEDIPPGMPSDHDYNDYIGYAVEHLPPPPPPPPVPTPEPGTLALLLSGGVMLWRKARA
jgi:hypothetical protein